MKILINLSNLYVGGGVQVALSLLGELRSFPNKHTYYIIISPVIQKQISTAGYPAHFNFILIEKSPSSLLTRKKITTILFNLEKKIKPAIVFSLFGPTFWRPQTVHLMGFANPWYIYPDSSAYDSLSFFNRLKQRLRTAYKSRAVKTNADYYIVESTETAKRLNNVLGIKTKNISTIGNTHSALYNQSKFAQMALPAKGEKCFRLVTISHNYSHKNLKIIRTVIPFLKDSPLDYEFVLTIDDASYNRLFKGFEKHVINLGPVDARFGPSIYQQSDALFLPTLLECFSASYPEAMKMKIPILTSNLPFATDLCQDAAMYFDPLNAQAVAESIIQISTDKQLQASLVKKGIKRLQTFETPKSRAQKYIELCERIVNKGNFRQ